MRSKWKLSPARRPLLLVNPPQMTVATGIIINHFYLHAAAVVPAFWAVGKAQKGVEAAVNGRRSHPRQREKSREFVTLPDHPAT